MENPVARWGRRGEAIGPVVDLKVLHAKIGELTLEEAIAAHGRAAMFNTDQGNQFTSEAFTDVLKSHQIEIGMDGKGSWHDNVFIKQLWRSVKYEEVYLHAYDSVAARASLGWYLAFYNRDSPHSGLDRCTPDEAYFNRSATPMAA